MIISLAKAVWPLLIVACLAVTNACSDLDDRRERQEANGVKVKVRSQELGDIPQLASVVRGMWKFKEYIQCGGSAYNPTALDSVPDTYISFEWPSIRFYFISSLSGGRFVSAMIDTMWLKSEEVNHEAPKYGPISGTCPGWIGERDSVHYLIVQMANEERWLELLSDSTMGYYYDGYFFIYQREE